MKISLSGKEGTYEPTLSLIQTAHGTLALSVDSCGHQVSLRHRPTLLIIRNISEPNNVNAVTPSHGQIRKNKYELSVKEAADATSSHMVRVTAAVLMAQTGSGSSGRQLLHHGGQVDCGT